jgi:hypothetical protein
MGCLIEASSGKESIVSTLSSHHSSLILVIFISKTAYMTSFLLLQSFVKGSLKKEWNVKDCNRPYKIPVAMLNSWSSRNPFILGAFLSLELKKVMPERKWEKSCPLGCFGCCGGCYLISLYLHKKLRSKYEDSHAKRFKGEILFEQKRRRNVMS